MVNNIIEGVAKALDQAFGDGYEIYRNDVKQGLKEPCFFLAVLQPSCDHLVGKRWQLTVPLDVHYFPSSGGDNRTMMDVALALTDVLEMIETREGELVRGQSMNFSIVDDVLHFLVTYQLILMVPNDGDPMEQVDLGVSLKEQR